MQEELNEFSLDTRKAEIVARSIDVYGATVDLLLSYGLQVGLTAADAVDRACELHEAGRSRAVVAALAHAPFGPPATDSAQLVERERRLLELNRDLQENEADPHGRSETYRLQRVQEVERALRECWAEMNPTAPDYVRLRAGEPATLDEVRALIASEEVPTAVVSFLCRRDHTTCFVLGSDAPGVATHQLDIGSDELDRAARSLRRAFNGAPDEFPPYPPIRRDRPGDRDLAFLHDAGARLLAFLPSVEGVELLCMAPTGRT